ncbi:cation diffusion facilitator family transporter [Bacillus sp. 165]|uniref:cation diffusion facilitator family transporter n=1 Tax=Bacillus sp. 165 TaxID=1529117 RepID=UPI001ADA63B5|nr:cation transporter [Bacillus sp. 165]
MRSSKIAGLSVASNTFVVLLKLIVGIITGSVAVISEAIHSSLDLAASVIAFFAVRIANKPPDPKHPYGHGKFENVSGTIETLLIFIAGIWIIYESVHKIIDPTPIRLPWLGIIVMLIGAVLNFTVGKIVQKVGRETRSVAMQSNALHLLTDVYSSLGVAVSLLLVSITNWTILDPLIGIAIALYIIKEAFHLVKESFNPLVDTGLAEKEEKVIQAILQSYKHRYIEYHDLRTRRSGSEEHVDLHLVVPSAMNVEMAHELCDEIEKDIQESLHNAKVLIHIEPEHERILTVNKANNTLND